MCVLCVRCVCVYVCVCVVCVCLCRFVYETEKFNGVAELLEILGRYVIMFH